MPRRLSQRDQAADRDAAAVDGWHELSVANPTFLLERLGSECSDLQGLRELTVNGLDAIAALGSGAGGRVVWDVDWLRFDASGGRVRKLSVTDTGTGMTPEQLRRYINQLASSGREQSAGGNVGVGAKVAAGSRNPHGLEYRSWHRGQSALVCFKRHSDGRWGLEPQRWPDGRSDFWRPLDEHEKPWLLRGQDHGTQVPLLGRLEARYGSMKSGRVRIGPERRARRLVRAEAETAGDHAVSWTTHGAELARQLNDLQQRLQRANDRLWSGPDAIAAVYDDHRAAADATVANSRSEIPDAPDPLREAHRAHWTIPVTFGAYQTIAERRRQLAIDVSELTADLIATLVAAKWPDQEGRSSDVRKLARTGHDVPEVRDQYHGLSEMPERSDRSR